MQTVLIIWILSAVLSVLFLRGESGLHPILGVLFAPIFVLWFVAVLLWSLVKPASRSVPKSVLARWHWTPPRTTRVHRFAGQSFGGDAQPGRWVLQVYCKTTSLKNEALTTTYFQPGDIDDGSWQWRTTSLQINLQAPAVGGGSTETSTASVWVDDR